MNYREIQPPDYLEDYVKSFWVFDCDETASSYHSFRLAADGSPGLIFQHNDSGAFHKEGKKLPPLFLYGQATSCYEVKLSGKFRTIGVYFYPDALKSVFGLNANELTNSCINPTQISNGCEQDISEKLLNADSTDQQIDIICKYLFAKIKRNSSLADQAIGYALRQFIGSNGNVTLKSILSVLPVSPRNFERKFQQQVGMSPKLFLRICQFQGTLANIEDKSYSKLSDVAFENGYADQSHFIRSFKEFAGISPGQYQKQTSGLFQNLSGIAG
ncbi:helix-turn-helix transcriptional regulator [Dyadobacter arcticus]|uniref:AraC-like DNA-binding protein n=1 Tax=Dyadobacter arcticus TaxID=1078754 RepID=A0ABX0URQ8_9BACT|nr:helix-turn-helix transcriptional regulator [Dyadobacter arcticus]NIJ54405.1 AraC-like DNA-binding protein [Dyadobacter arcticus]